MDDDVEVWADAAALRPYWVTCSRHDVDHLSDRPCEECEDAAMRRWREYNEPDYDDEE